VLREWSLFIGRGRKKFGHLFVGGGGVFGSQKGDQKSFS